MIIKGFHIAEVKYSTIYFAYNANSFFLKCMVACEQLYVVSRIFILTVFIIIMG